jgi:threonine/homoserine/homoserine lactone efflux protein
MEYLLNGILLGLTLAIMVGPIVFVIIEAGIEKGFFSGLFAALGIWLSDFLFIIFTYTFISNLMDFQESDKVKFWLGLAGGIILIIIGIGTILKTKKLTKSLKPKAYNYPSLPQNLNYFIKGFLVNTINPFTVFFWISVMAGLTTQNQMHTSNAYLLIFGIMVVIILTDILKAYFASYLKKKLNIDFINKIRKIAGLAFILFGVVLIAQIFI